MKPTLVDGHPQTLTGPMTVLDVCRAAGADVPTLCHDERFTRLAQSSGGGGHCRMCMVSVDGRFVAACTTPAQPGSVIVTHSQALHEYRRDLLELTSAESRLAGRVKTLADALEVRGDRYHRHATHDYVDRSHPYLTLDTSTCIRCRLCEGVCDAVQGQFVWAFAGRGADTHLVFDAANAPFRESPCVACGACVSVCPSGALSDRDRARPRQPKTARTVQTTCGYCGVGCQLAVTVDGDDHIHQVDGVPDAPANRGHLCVKGRYAHAFTRHPERLTTPLVRKRGELVPVSWDEALDRVAHGLMAIHAAGGEVGAISSARCTNEENYLLQKWMRAAFHTHNVDCCARVCHAPSAAGMRKVFGTGAATSSLADIELADCFLVAGSNTTEAHPVTGARIRHQVLAGHAKLIVIDPRKTELAALADVHLQLRPGTNIALLNALAHAIIRLELVDESFIAGRTTGFESYLTFIERYSPESTAAETGVPPDKVWVAARLYGTARRPLQVHGLGMTEHFQGSEAVMLLCNLALLVGGVGREGAGVNPLRGQNNVQGAADMGCQPDLLTGYQRPDDAAVRQRFEHVWGHSLPTQPGRTLPRMYDAARTKKLRGLFILGEDVVQTDPQVHVDAALGALDFLVVQELFLTETAKRAHVVLPGASFLEKDGTFTSGERRIQHVRKAIAPYPGAREDWRILLDLMARTGLVQSLSSPAEIRAEIAQVAPLFAGIDRQALPAEGLQWPVPTSTHPGTPRLHEHGFAAFESGKAPFAEVDALASPSLADAAEYPLRLVTGRVLAHYNSGTMTRRTANALLSSEDSLAVSPADLAALGLGDGARVTIKSPWGATTARARASDSTAPGTVFLTFHYPETRTNALMSPVLDRLSDCPEYKLTPVRIERA